MFPYVHAAETLPKCFLAFSLTSEELDTIFPSPGITGLCRGTQALQTRPTLPFLAAMPPLSNLSPQAQGTARPPGPRGTTFRHSTNAIDSPTPAIAQVFLGVWSSGAGSGAPGQQFGAVPVPN